MKNVIAILSFLFLALGCSYEDITNPSSKDAPPVNHAKAMHSPKGRDDCSNVWIAFRTPNAQNTLYNQYSYIPKPNTVNISWYTENMGGGQGYFPVADDPTLTLSLYGPSPNYPLVNTTTVTNNTNGWDGVHHYGTTTSQIFSSYTNGWYYYKLESDRADGSCRVSAVDIYIKDF
jgi:hypothetical protein